MFDSPDNMIYVLGCFFWIVILVIGWTIIKIIWNVIWGILKGIFSIFVPASEKKKYLNHLNERDTESTGSNDGYEYKSPTETREENEEQRRREEKWEEDERSNNKWLWGDEKGFSHWFWDKDDDDD